MFLLERMFGIGVYMLILLYVCLVLAKTNVSCRSILRGYLVCLCVMAFLYKPYVTADLYRLYEQIDFFATMELERFWQDYAIPSSTPVARLLFWCIGKIGIKPLLPAISAFLCYSFVFYIVNKTKKIYAISNQSVAVVLFFVMTTSIYISVIGGIRMMLALSMIAFSYFRATVEKKRSVLDLLLYTVSIFIHVTALPILAICVFSSLIDFKKKFARRIILAVLACLGGVVLLVRFNSTVNQLYQKFLAYVLGDRYSDPWEYVMGALIIMALAVTFMEFRPFRTDDECRAVKGLNSVAIFCVIIAICFCFEFSIFYRFGGHFAVMFSIPSMMVALEKTKGKPSAVIKGVDFRTVLLLLSMIIAVISCARGSLSSLKFFEL